jgi:two-component system sensor histidine kinase AlgZ
MMGPQRAEPWLPDLCRLPRLAAMMGLAQLTVVVVALVPDGSRGWEVHGFLTASGYALWLALSVAALLCVSRRWLSSLPMRAGALASVAIAVAVSGIAAAIVHGLFASVDTTGALPSFWRFTAGSAAVVALLTALALRYFYVIDRWQAHFLFNSMNMIASLLRRDPAVAERAVLDLSDLFRAALGAGEGQSSLAEELDLSERYLGIEQLRMGDRLQIRWRKHEPLPMDLPMPRLVLQPLVENAVLHGISRLPAGGLIEIDLSQEQHALVVAVRNPAPPPRERDGPHADGGSPGAQHAQTSIGQRLRYAYGPQAKMTAGWADHYYLCELRVPTGMEALNR